MLNNFNYDYITEIQYQLDEISVVVPLVDSIKGYLEISQVVQGYLLAIAIFFVVVFICYIVYKFLRIFF